MRSITKTRWGTDALLEEHQNPPQTHQQATTRWRRFGSDNKGALQKVLLKEQYHLCCYSEINAALRGLGYHIEHVENKSQQPDRTFDYRNLAASALDSANDLQHFRNDAFGGHAVDKQQSVDMAKFIHCHLTDCARYFAYLSDGRIEPKAELSDQEKICAQYTIDLLNLNCGFLVVERRKHWDELQDLFDEHQGDRWDLLLLLQLDLVPTADNRLYEFFSLTRQFFAPLAEQVLQEHAPDLV